jgi:hypothetical protein
LPNELQEVAVAARKNVVHGQISNSGNAVSDGPAKDPKNLDALSNLGVVYFRTGKDPIRGVNAEESLAIAPNDDFVLTTLGIVHYRQSRFDER